MPEASIEASNVSPVFATRLTKILPRVDTGHCLSLMQLY